jgi:hypothetical protein
LKIKRSAEEDFVVFTLSGRIKVEDLAKLQRLFESEREDQNTILELTEVKLVDQKAVRFLARCEMVGIKFKHRPAYIREWVARVQEEKYRHHY